MSVRSFLDTNVLVYSDDHDSPVKRAQSLELVERTQSSGTGVVSTQVLQEYFATVTRKLLMPVPGARMKVEILCGYDVVRIQPDDVLSAIDLRQLHELSFWDALIVRCALRAGCSILYTEDVQPGRRFERLELVNGLDPIPWTHSERRIRCPR